MDDESIRLCVFGAFCLTGAALSSYQTRRSYLSYLSDLHAEGEIDEQPTFWNSMRLIKEYTRKVNEEYERLNGVQTNHDQYC